MKVNQRSKRTETRSNAQARLAPRALLFALLTNPATAPLVAHAGIVDTPLPTFADGTPSVQVLAVPLLAKREHLETEFFCTALDDAPIDIGVQAFDATGALLNDITAGSGAVSNVAPGQTVTISTGLTATYKETVVIPLTSRVQGSARVVASSRAVRCNVMLVDDSVTPPVTLATLEPGVRPTAEALPVTIPLPQFADGHAATHTAVFAGAVKRGSAQTEVFCTSLAREPVDIGVEVIGPSGTVGNSVANGNGAVLNVAPGQTVTFGTTGSRAFLETQVIVLAGVAQGAARVVSTSADVLCTALVLDAGVAPPTAMSGLAGDAPPPSAATLPGAIPRFADGKGSVVIQTAPGTTGRGRLQTDVMCTVVGSEPADIGAQIFDASGTLLNDVSAGVGALLDVAPGATVTFGTSGTATYLETTVIPVGAVAQGIVRVVASTPAVRCNVMLLDNAVAPPVALATLGQGAQPAPGALPVTSSLPRFSDGQAATHALLFPGAVKRNTVETDVICTSLATTPIDVGVEILGPDGVLQNGVEQGNGALLDVQPGATVTFGTTGTLTFSETTVIVTGAVAQGVARVVSTSDQLLCTAVVVDAGVTPPTSLTTLLAATLSDTSIACPGDCDMSGTVTIEELLRGVNVALSLSPLTDCRSFDVSGDGTVTVDELLAAVNAALKGC